MFTLDILTRQKIPVGCALLEHRHIQICQLSRNTGNSVVDGVEWRQGETVIRGGASIGQ